MRLIDADAVRPEFDKAYKKTRRLIQDGENHLDNLAEGFHEADGVIWSMPTIDAVPVVRCRECKYFEAHPYEPGHWLCQRGRARRMEPNDFCSYGEQKN